VGWARLGRCSYRRLENEMKRGWIVLLTALFIALGAFLWEFERARVFLVMFVATEPAGRGCDEGQVSDQRVSNGRGDIVAAHLRVCTGFGTVVDYSIVLQLRGDEKTTKLVEHDWLNEYPKFRWINDDSLSIDLGKVHSVWSTVHKVGSIRITYTYDKTDTGW
jgi:hypothetical protein